MGGDWNGNGFNCRGTCTCTERKGRIPKRTNLQFPYGNVDET